MTFKSSVMWAHEVAGLANLRCKKCNGLGVDLEESRKADETIPCDCVLRKIFRACLYRYQEIMESSRCSSPVVTSRFLSSSRPFEEFVADFEVVSRRTLQAYPLHLKVFNRAIICGIDVRDDTDRRSYSRALRMSEIELAKTIYVIEVRLGRIFRELQPYPLFPLYEYFGQGLREDRTTDSRYVWERNLQSGSYFCPGETLRPVIEFNPDKLLPSLPAEDLPKAA